jgi:hypothetical protein
MVCAAWAGTRQVVDLLDADLETGALLLEKVAPGARLNDQPGLPPFEEIARLLASLRSPAEISLTSCRRWPGRSPGMQST